MFGRFKSQKSEKDAEFYRSTVEKLVSLQLSPAYAIPREAFGALMTNKSAAGYVFGFHDATVQAIGLRDAQRREKAAALIQSSY